jgi:formylglycine-generating enzyme required for sulfatase activity
MKRICAFLFAAVLVAFAFGCGQDSAQLKEKDAELEKRVAVLEKKFQILEKKRSRRGMPRTARSGGGMPAPGKLTQRPSETGLDVPEGMVLVFGGSYWMGCAKDDQSCQENEKPRHQVEIKPMFMDATETTVEQYADCVKKEKCTPPDAYQEKERAGCTWNREGREKHPVNCVDWNQAAAYCAFKGGRLPTEAEWEYAARGGREDRYYPWGNDKADCTRAVMNDGGPGCGENSTAPVKSKPMGVNGYGLYDMSGNAHEWTADWFDQAAYASHSKVAPTGPKTGTEKVLRGGAWYLEAWSMGVSSRSAWGPENRGSGVGFRCVKKVEVPKK